MDITTIEFKVELFAEVLLNVLDVAEVSEAQVVNLVSEVKSVSLHVKSLNHFRIMVTTDMEIAWNFVNEDEPAKFTTFLIVKSLDSFIEYLLRLPLPSLGLQEVLLSDILSINFGVSAILDVLNHTNLVSVLVEAVLVELSFDVDEVHASHVHYVETQNLAGTFWKGNIQVDM